MLTIVQASGTHHFEQADVLTWEYLVAAGAELRSRYGVELDIAAAHAHDIEARTTYVPPDGRLLLASVDEAAAGCVRLRRLGAGTGEVKRLYVRPAYRGHGVGAELVARVVREARAAGYRRLRLDSSRFQRSAHALYRAAGFRDIDPYPGSEIPEAYRDRWVFMELVLDG